VRILRPADFLALRYGIAQAPNRNQASKNASGRTADALTPRPSQVAAGDMESPGKDVPGTLLDPESHIHCNSVSDYNR